ncbi:MAG: NfeD family protein [Clostridia bacterium]
MTFWQEIVLAFSEIGIIPAICIILGLILVIIEIFQPGFGFCGITGGILIFVGLGIRVANSGEGNPITQFFILLGVCLIVLLFAFGIMIFSLKRGWLSRTPMVEHATVFNKNDKSEATKNYDTLLGKEGTAKTDLKPSGWALIDGETYDVTIETAFVIKGAKVVVTKIEGNKIVVNTID